MTNLLLKPYTGSSMRQTRQICLKKKICTYLIRDHWQIPCIWKPIKASQYAAHAECCRASNSTEDIATQLDGGGGHKKPPRKGKKKWQTAYDNQGMTVGEQEKSESVGGDDGATSESNTDDRNGTASLLSREANGGEVQKRLIVQKKEPSDAVTGYQRAGQALEHGLLNNGYLMSEIPAPLATKIYFPQGNLRLRAALGRLYSVAVAKEHGCDVIKNKLIDNPILPSEDAAQEKLLHGVPKDNISQAKKDAYPTSTVRNPDQILAQSSELCLGSAGGYPPVMSFSNQSQESKFPMSGMAVDTAPMETKRTRYHPSQYSFSSNAGTALGTMQQQPNGSVHVV